MYLINLMKYFSIWIFDFPHPKFQLIKMIKDWNNDNDQIL